MRRIVEIPVSKVVPTAGAVLSALGSRGEAGAGTRVARLLGDALQAFRAEAEPRGVVADVDAAEFAEIYHGEGDNEDPSPLMDIFPLADALALFAVTVGGPLSNRIAALFDAGDPALGAALDAAASEATVRAGAYLERVALEDALSEGNADEDTQVLSYSPGYCGWNLTGQKMLFEALGPEEIGIRLKESCLMEPLKSISGVAVMGPREIHEFTDDFDFCSDCGTRDCRNRVRTLEKPKSQGERDGDPEADRR
jgi:hypothetical protein